jgi:6-phosphogluconolactonase
MSQEMQMRCYVGGYGPEISVVDLDPEDGSMDVVKRVTTPKNASFLVAVSDPPLLYAAVESGYQSGDSGKVASYKLDAELLPVAIGSAESCGVGPCHIDIDYEQRLLAVANYGGENFALLRIRDDGKPTELLSCVPHEGHSINAARQEEPHPHAVNFSPDGRWLFVCDLGIDAIVRYAVADLVNGSGVGERAAVATPGSGPRHIVFSTDGAFVYLINELSNTVVGYAYDSSAGTLEQIQEIKLLADSFDGESTAAEIVIHPSGRYLYASNRGHDSITIYARNTDDGTLTLSGHADTTGSGPRHFSIDPTGSWCLIANQGTDHVVSFRVEDDGAKLRWSGHSIQVPAASCAVFWPVPRQP